MSAEKNVARDLPSQRCDCILKSRAVVRGVARPGRSPGSGLPKGKIAAQHGESSGRERLSQSDQQRGLRISAGSVSQEQAIMVGIVRKVQKSANARGGGVIDQRLHGRPRQATILNPATSFFVRLRILQIEFDRPGGDK